MPCEIDGIASGYATKGHRFHASGDITIGSAADYQDKLRACHVIVDHEERAAIIRKGAAKAASDAGLVLVEDEGLVIENAGLTEWPVPLLGRFDEAFLEVPPEVIQLTARTNQKYFVCTSPLPLAGGGGGGPDSPTPNPSRKREGELASAFICTANIAAVDGGAGIVAGNRKVLAARLSDARFFWEQDRKKSLEEHAKGLARITFHEKLGTVADKVERVAKLARWLVEEGIIKESPLPLAGGAGGGPVVVAAELSPTPNPSRKREGDLATLAEQAARLCKADLVTEMVGEFPELQGLMGGYYARAEGLDPQVADAIRDHYKPVGQGDDVPTAPVTVAVSLADKLDTLVGFFAVDERPTGSKDPFALRRAAISIVRLVIKNELGFGLVDALRAAFSGFTNESRKGLYLTWWREEGDETKIDSINDDNIDDYADTILTLAWDTSDWSKITKIQGARLLPLNELRRKLLEFLADRLKVQQREAGVRHDLIDAVFALGGEDDLVRLLARVHALQAFMATDDGKNLHAGYKRAANILKKEGETPLPFRGGAGGGGCPSDAPLANTPHPLPSPEGEGLESQALLTALNLAEPTAAAAIAAEDFTAAMAALASLRAPIDAFFEGVMVNDPDPEKRAFRLGLLTRFRDAVHQVADFSRIEG